MADPSTDGDTKPGTTGNKSKSKSPGPRHRNNNNGRSKSPGPGRKPAAKSKSPGRKQSMSKSPTRPKQTNSNAKPVATPGQLSEAKPVPTVTPEAPLSSQNANSNGNKNNNEAKDRARSPGPRKKQSKSKSPSRPKTTEAKPGGPSETKTQTAESTAATPPPLERNEHFLIDGYVFALSHVFYARQPRACRDAMLAVSVTCTANNTSTAEKHELAEHTEADLSNKELTQELPEALQCDEALSSIISIAKTTEFVATSQEYKPDNKEANSSVEKKPDGNAGKAQANGTANGAKIKGRSKSPRPRRQQTRSKSPVRQNKSKSKSPARPNAQNGSKMASSSSTSEIEKLPQFAQFDARLVGMFIATKAPATAAAESFNATDRLNVLSVTETRAKMTTRKASAVSKIPADPIPPTYIEVEPLSCQMVPKGIAEAINLELSKTWDERELAMSMVTVNDEEYSTPTKSPKREGDNEVSEDYWQTPPTNLAGKVAFFEKLTKQKQEKPKVDPSFKVKAEVSEKVRSAQDIVRTSLGGSNVAAKKASRSVGADLPKDMTPLAQKRERVETFFEKEDNIAPKVPINKLRASSTWAKVETAPPSTFVPTVEEEKDESTEHAKELPRESSPPVEKMVSAIEQDVKKETKRKEVPQIVTDAESSEPEAVAATSSASVAAVDSVEAKKDIKVENAPSKKDQQRTKTADAEIAPETQEPELVGSVLPSPDRAAPSETAAESDVSKKLAETEEPVVTKATTGETEEETSEEAVDQQSGSVDDHAGDDVEGMEEEDEGEKEKVEEEGEDATPTGVMSDSIQPDEITHREVVAAACAAPVVAVIGAKGDISVPQAAKTQTLAGGVEGAVSTEEAHGELLSRDIAKEVLQDSEDADEEVSTPRKASPLKEEFPALSQAPKGSNRSPPRDGTKKSYARILAEGKKVEQPGENDYSRFLNPTSPEAKAAMIAAMSRSGAGAALSADLPIDLSDAFASAGAMKGAGEKTEVFATSATLNRVEESVYRTRQPLQASGGDEMHAGEAERVKIEEIAQRLAEGTPQKSLPAKAKESVPGPAKESKKEVKAKEPKEEVMAKGSKEEVKPKAKANARADSGFKEINRESKRKGVEVSSQVEQPIPAVVNETVKERPGFKAGNFNSFSALTDMDGPPTEIHVTKGTEKGKIKGPKASGRAASPRRKKSVRFGTITIKEAQVKDVKVAPEEAPSRPSLLAMPVHLFNNLSHTKPICYIVDGLVWFSVLVMFGLLLAIGRIIMTFYRLLTYPARLLGFGTINPRRMRGQKLAVFITGCDSGFGRELAFALLREGFVVFCACLNKESLRDFADEEQAIPIHMDVAKDSDVEKACKKVGEWLSEEDERYLHALVNNAGIGTPGLVDWSSISEVEKILEVNFYGMVRCSKKFLPHFKAQAADGYSSARIINMVSMAGLVSAAPFMFAYTASKHAAEVFTTNLRLETKGLGLNVTVINPSFHKTLLTKDMSSDLKSKWKSLSPEKQKEYGEAFLNMGSAGSDVASIKINWDSKNVVAAMRRGVMDKAPPSRILVGMDARYLFIITRMLPAWLTARLIKLKVPPALMKKATS